MSTEIRILTGLHAGAQMNLQAGTHHVGGSAGDDIRISDWDGPSLVMSVSEDGRVTVAKTDESGDAHASELLAELAPRRYGSIVMVVGDADAPWPSDVELLERLLGAAPAAAPAPESKRSTRLAPVLRWGALCGAMLIGVTVGAHQQDRKPVHAGPPTPEELLPRLSAILAAEDQPELSVSATRDHVKVKGLVASAADLAAVTRALERLAPGKVRTEVTVVNDVLENLQVSLGDPRLSARYLGDGRFEVSGRSAQPERVKGIVDKIRLDLGTNVSRIELDIHSADTGLPRNTDAAVNAGGLSYTETTDGIKHFLSAGMAPAIRQAL